MRVTLSLGASLLGVLALTACVPAAEPLTSGPQVGSSKIPVFNPLNVNGAQAGDRACQV